MLGRNDNKSKGKEQIAQFPKDMLDFNDEGYDDEGYDIEGYNRQGFDRSGFKRGDERKLKTNMKAALGKELRIVQMHNRDNCEEDDGEEYADDEEQEVRHGKRQRSARGDGEMRGVHFDDDDNDGANNSEEEHDEEEDDDEDNGDDDDVDEDEYDYEDEYSFELDPSVTSSFDPLLFHMSLGMYLEVNRSAMGFSGTMSLGEAIRTERDSARSSRVFAVIAVMADPWTTPSDTGEYDEFLPSLSMVCDVVLAVCLPMYGDDMQDEGSEFRFACDLATILLCCTEKLHCKDEEALQKAIVSSDWQKTVQNWVPDSTLSNIVYLASDFHRLRLVYTICVVCVTVIGRLFAWKNNACLNPFLYMLLRIYKLQSKVILLGLQVDRQDESQGFPGYPEEIRYVVKGSSALRSATALVLNDDYARRVHDFKHETLEHFMGPWGRRVGNSRLRCDNRVFASSLLSMGTSLDDVGDLMKGFHTEDRYDEDIKYMFEMEFESDPEDEYSRQHEESMLLRTQPKPPIAYGPNLRHAYGLDGVLRTYRMHPDCMCKLDGIHTGQPDSDADDVSSDYDFTDSIKMVIQNPGSDDGGSSDDIEGLLSDIIEHETEAGEENEEDDDDSHDESDDGDQKSTKQNSQDGNNTPDGKLVPPQDKRRVVWTAITRNMDSSEEEEAVVEEDGNCNKVGGKKSKSKSKSKSRHRLKRFIITPVSRKIWYDSSFRDRRDIRRGENNKLSADFEKLLKRSASGEQVFILPMHSILSKLATMRTDTLSAKECQKIISSVAFVVKYGEENILMTDEQRQKFGNDDHIRPEYILSYICSFPGMIKMISRNPSATFFIIDELLMVEGFRTSLLWFLANCEPNQWIFNYFHELIIGQRGNPDTTEDPRTSRYAFSRQGEIVISETELRMVIKELLANVTGYVIRKLQDEERNDRDAIQRLMKVVCLFLKSLDSRHIVSVNDSDWRLEVQTLLLQWINSGLVPEARELFFKSQRNVPGFKVVSEKEKVFRRQVQIVRECCADKGINILLASKFSPIKQMRFFLEFSIRYELIHEDVLKALLAKNKHLNVFESPSRLTLVCDALFGALYSVALDKELYSYVGSSGVLELFVAAHILTPKDLKNESTKPFLETKIAQMQAYGLQFFDDISRPGKSDKYYVN